MTILHTPGDSPKAHPPEQSPAPQPPEDGGPAFPVPQHDSLCPLTYGMSLRDHFAGLAVVGILAQHSIDHTESGYPDGNPKWGVRNEVDRQIVTSCAYAIADAMIAARKQGGEQR